MRLRRLTTPAAVLAAAALTLTACGGDADVEGGATDTETGTEAEATGEETGETTGEISTITEGTLTVCSEIPYPPFEFEAEDGSFTGFDIDLITAVAEEIGLEADIVNTSFEGIQSGAALGARQCDVAASAMTITEEREENLDFSDPYFEAEQSLLTTTDSGISALDEMEDGIIAVQAETTGAAYANENAPEGVQITDFTSGADAITALQSGQVDAVLQDLGPNADAVSKDDTLAVVETYPTDESYGFAVAEEGSDALLEAINDALATLRENGTYDEIYTEYFPGG